MYCGAMSGLLKKKMKNLGKPALLRWQMSDSQYSRGSAVTDVSDSVQHSLLYRKFKSGDANDASPAVHFQDAAPQDELKDDGSPCSHNTLISDRKVFKIKMFTEPLMREEPFNNCTSSGALPTLNTSQDVPDVLPNQIQKPRAQLPVKEGPRGVTQHYLQDNIMHNYTAKLSCKYRSIYVYFI